MSRMRAATVAVLCGSLVRGAAARDAAPEEVLGYLRSVPAEGTAEREARHRRIAERRKGPVVIVHRGASSFAPENTLEAYSAAMDQGADGCEVDVRRTKDGVLVLFHDDMLDHLTDGFGDVSELTYVELLSLRPRSLYGNATAQTRPPTFASLLEVARKRAMLLHLDVKSKDLDEELGALLDTADAWDHVVAVNGETAPRLAKHEKVRILRYKPKAGIYETWLDVDPEAVKSTLEGSGEMIMVGDPRVAAKVLGRTPSKLTPISLELRERWMAASPAQVATRLGSVLEAIDALEKTEPCTSPGRDAEEDRKNAERILTRARAAQRLGDLPAEDAAQRDRAVASLEGAVRARSLHRDWRWHGLDGAMAVLALGRLRSTRSVSLLSDSLLRVDPALASVAAKEFGEHPLGWTDWRIKTYTMLALADLPCEASRLCLEKYLSLGEGEARALAPELHDLAARALLRQELSSKQLEGLLRSRSSVVRGTAILDCLDRASDAREAALKACQPWALALPRAAQTP